MERQPLKPIEGEDISSDGNRETTPTDQQTLSAIFRSLPQKGHEGPYYLWPEDTQKNGSPIFVINDRDGNTITCDRKTGNIISIKPRCEQNI